MAPTMGVIRCGILMLIAVLFVKVAMAADIFLDWQVSVDLNMKPVSTDQLVGFNLIEACSSYLTDFEKVKS